MVVASELLLATPAIANLIATGQIGQIYAALEGSVDKGMQPLNDDLARLLVSNRISETAAASVARSPKTLQERAAMLRRRAAEGKRFMKRRS